MSPSTTTRSPRRKRIMSEVRLDELLTEFDRLGTVLATAEATKAASIEAATKAADEVYNEEVGSAPTEFAELQKELTAFLVQRRTALMRRFRGTITRPMGVVKYVHDEPEMDWPAKEQPVVAQIVRRLDGAKWLTFPPPKLDKKAILKSAPPELLAELRPHGVWKGQHLFIKVQTQSMKEFITLERRRYKERPPRPKEK
ncbi:MAG: hypothetical protein JWN28_667 [Candidatus Saccharibacteria bacterium]|nr:hypothetical protein [Candidatus Saccharibacteria bacterium]